MPLSPVQWTKRLLHCFPLLFSCSISSPCLLVSLNRWRKADWHSAGLRRLIEVFWGLRE